jgi:hypothetical protein
MACDADAHFENYPYIGVYVNNYSRALLKAILESGHRAITAKKV